MNKASVLSLSLAVQSNSA